MKKILILIILSTIFISSCVNVTGKDKEVLDASVVWADSIYKIAEKENGNISGLVLLKWLDQNRCCWALFAGANEGITSTEVLEELNKKEVLQMSNLPEKWKFLNDSWIKFEEQIESNKNEN